MTDFDRQIHLFPLSNCQYRAVIPEFTMEYSDDSEDERYYNCSPQDAQKEMIATKEPRNAPEAAARRPKRPRVQAEHFKKANATKLGTM
jgi:hypothetical protein